jgi:holliday junction DNA helicase RuvA
MAVNLIGLARSRYTHFMFNSLVGTITEKHFDLLRVENNGLEWEFSVPARSIDEFGNVGGKTRVFIYLLHREDQMRLYGFPSEEEKAIFLELIKVDGIGPKQAVKILSGIAAEELSSALDTEDMTRLQQVPGLGSKTAQKLIFALKGKLPGKSAAEAPSKWSDVIRALTDMGYDRKRVAETVARLAAELGGKGGTEVEQELFRKAIVELSS